MDFSKVRNYIFLGTLSVVTILFLYVVEPFAYPIFWAAIIASLFYPVYRWLNKLIGPSVSSFLTIILVTVIVILPLSVIGALLVREVAGIFDSSNSSQGQINEFIRSFGNTLQNNKYLRDLNLDNSLVSQQIDTISRSAVNFVYLSVKSFTQNSVEFLALFVLMLYTLFFFLRDGKRILEKLMYIFPLNDKYEHLLYEKFTSTASATIKGTIVVGAIQGLCGGILFYLAGVPSPLIWALVMAALSAIPVTGAFLVWVPAAIFKLLTGHLAAGLLILAGGTLVVSTIDNMLRPIIVGRDIQMHPVVVLFSTLGGVVVFGLSGFVIGPIIAALCQSFWEIYEQYYKSELTKN